MAISRRMGVSRLAWPEQRGSRMRRRKYVGCSLKPLLLGSFATALVHRAKTLKAYRNSGHAVILHCKTVTCHPDTMDTA